MSLGFWQIALIAVLVLLLFGRGKISELMGDVAKGITSFKKGLRDDDDADEKPDEEDGPRKAITDKRSVKADAPKSKSRVKSDDAGKG